MQTQDNDNGSNHNFTHLYETLTDEAAMKVKVNERVSELELVQANHSTRGANDFALDQLLGYERFSMQRRARLLNLNTQTPSPPRGAVPVNRGRTWETLAFLFLPDRLR